MPCSPQLQQASLCFSGWERVFTFLILPPPEGFRFVLLPLEAACLSVSVARAQFFLPKQLSGPCGILSPHLFYPHRGLG